MRDHESFNAPHAGLQNPAGGNFRGKLKGEKGMRDHESFDTLTAGLQNPAGANFRGKVKGGKEMRDHESFDTLTAGLQNPAGGNFRGKFKANSFIPGKEMRDHESFDTLTNGSGNSVELVYGDFLGDKWTDYSSKGNYHYDESSEVYEGNHAIRADYKKWGGLQVADNNGFNSEGITSLSFFIKVTGTSTDPILVWVDDKNRRINPKNNEWEHVVLPLSLFESPSKISSVVFQNDSGKARR
eukprot:scaffold33985_cov25-Attheya_sp.AAC.1